jgi:hypothetical protein
MRRLHHSSKSAPIINAARRWLSTSNSSSSVSLQMPPLQSPAVSSPDLCHLSLDSLGHLSPDLGHQSPLTTPPDMLYLGVVSGGGGGGGSVRVGGDGAGDREGERGVSLRRLLVAKVQILESLLRVPVSRKYSRALIYDNMGPRVA